MGNFLLKIARTVFHPEDISYVCRMINRPGNESGRSWTDYHAGRIIIPHRPTKVSNRACSNQIKIFRGLLMIGTTDFKPQVDVILS